MEIKKNIVMKVLIFILIIFQIGSNAQKIKSLEVKLLEKEIKLAKNYSDLIGNPELKKIEYSITNNANRTFILIIDTTNLYMYSNIYFKNRWSKINEDDTDKQLFQIGIRIGNNGKFISTSYNIISKYFENLPSLDYIVNQNIVIIKAGETIKKEIVFTYPLMFNKTNNGGLAQFFLLDDPEYFSVFLFQDKNLIMKHLNKENKKKIKSLNAEIYTGLLESNKIPVILE